MERLREALEAIVPDIERANLAMREEGIEPDQATSVVLAAAKAVLAGRGVQWCVAHNDKIRALYSTCHKAYLLPSFDVECIPVERLLVDPKEIKQ